MSLGQHREDVVAEKEIPEKDPRSSWRCHEEKAFRSKAGECHAYKEVHLEGQSSNCVVPAGQGVGCLQL